jgi:hypothetical protein
MSALARTIVLICAHYTTFYPAVKWFLQDCDEVRFMDGIAMICADFLAGARPASALWLTKTFADAHSERLSLEEATEAPSIIAVGGEIGFRVGRVAAIRPGGLAIQEPVTKFSPNTAGLFAGSDLAGVIGGAALCHFRVIFD